MSNLKIWHKRLSNAHILPKKIGSYVIIHTHDNILAKKYVGSTNNLLNRMSAHLCRDIIGNIIYIDIYVTEDIKTARSLEKILMKLIRPVTNVNIPPLSDTDKEIMKELLEDDNLKKHIADDNIKIGCRYLKCIIGNKIEHKKYIPRREGIKPVLIEEEIHEILKQKSKEFKEKNNYELPLGIIIGKVCRKYLKDIELL